MHTDKKAQVSETYTQMLMHTMNAISNVAGEKITVGLLSLDDIKNTYIFTSKLPKSEIRTNFLKCIIECDTTQLYFFVFHCFTKQK